MPTPREELEQALSEASAALAQDDYMRVATLGSRIEDLATKADHASSGWTPPPEDF